jgi:hypothetical protein
MERPIQTVVLFGAFGPPLITFQRSCKAQGISSHWLEVSSQQAAGNNHRMSPTLRAFIPPRKVETPEGLEIIRKFVNLVGAQAIIAVSESHLLWLIRNRHIFDGKCTVLASSERSLTFLASKKRQLELASQVGFELLPTWYLFGDEDSAQIPANQFPVCIRPTVPGAVKPTFKAVVIHSPAELRSFLDNRQVTTDPIVAQPFRSLPNLQIHGVRAEDGRMLALEPFLSYRRFEAVTLSLRRTTFPPSIEGACRDFAAEAGITGPFHFEFLISAREQRAYYLEINVRLGGTTDKTAQLGYDQPALTLAAFGFSVQPRLARTQRAFSGVVNKRAVLKHIWYALRGRLTELDYPPVSGFRHICSSCSELVLAKDSIFDPRDLKNSVRFHLRKPAGV